MGLSIGSTTAIPVNAWSITTTNGGRSMSPLGRKLSFQFCIRNDRIQNDRIQYIWDMAAVRAPVHLAASARGSAPTLPCPACTVR